MNPDVYEIDWRSEFDRLRVAMRGNGCVVRVSHDENISAWRRFDAVLINAFEQMHPKSVSIRIDSHWHNTRTLDDILSAFDESLEDAGIPAIPIEITRAAPISVLSQNKVDGDATFSVGTININGDRSDNAKQRKALVLAICERCRKLLDLGDRLMIVVHHCPVKDQSRFWCDLWNRGLGALISKGLLLVHYVTKSQPAHGDAPNPNCVIQLPRDFSEETREEHAYDDLIDMLMKLGVGKEMASGLSMAHINSTKLSMTNFYDKLSSLVLKVQILTR